MKHTDMKFDIFMLLNAGCHYAEYSNTECHYTESCNVECHNAESCNALMSLS